MLARSAMVSGLRNLPPQYGFPRKLLAPLHPPQQYRSSAHTRWCPIDDAALHYPVRLVSSSELSKAVPAISVLAMDDPSSSASSASSSAALGKSPQGYQHACQRAELLGLATPTEAEWLASEECARERETQEQDAHDDAVAQELDGNDESMKRIGGGLDELNTILNATQKKINKFKTVCGSIGTLLKARVSSQPGTPEHKSRAGSSSEAQPSDGEQQVEQPLETSEETNEPDLDTGDERQRMTAKKTDLNSKVGSHLDKLDSLISKAENAQYSMKHQTKQIKSFLK